MLFCVVSLDSRKKMSSFLVASTLWLSLLLGDSRYIGKNPVKNCLNARAKMTSDKFDDERLLARKTNENKMKNG